MAASYAGCDQTLVVLFFTISVGSQSLTIPGTYVNPLDLSPNYVGPLTALVNGMGSSTGILAPYVIGLLTPNVRIPWIEPIFFFFRNWKKKTDPSLSCMFQSLVSEWRTVFWLTFAIYMMAIVVFTLWGSGDVQKWNWPESTRPSVDTRGRHNSTSNKTLPETYKIFVFILYNLLLLFLFTYIWLY